MYSPLKNLSHFSLRQSIQKPADIAKRCKELGITSAGLTDFCTLAGAMEFHSECKSNGVKPIFGVKLSTPNGYITVLARNHTGWKNLIKLVSKSHDNHQQGIPTTGLGLLGQYSSDLIGICSGTGFIENGISELSEMFNHNLYLDIDSAEPDWFNDKIRTQAAKYNLPTVATSESVFANPKDIEDYKILLASDKKCLLKDLNFDVPKFFRSQSEIKATQEEIELSSGLADMCESYNITNKPMLPKFDCPGGISEKDYLEQLIYSSKRYNGSQEFIDRLNVERPVLSEANLDGYFLIVNDYTQFARSRGALALGRGSSAGSLISYLLELTVANPLTYDLLFERFYNPGRNTKDHVSYPDIDMDFPREIRDEVIVYIKEKYGYDKVAQMITFGRMQGAGALKEVFRAHNACDTATQNAITENMPDEASIADDLENDDEDSIIRWVLHNRPNLVSDYARLNDDGEIVGDYARYFEQAIRIEGVYRTSGKHAAGIVIGPEALDNICPMVMDSKGETKIVGYDMKATEKAGLIKMDILGVAALDKLKYAQELIRGLK